MPPTHFTPRANMTSGTVGIMRMTPSLWPPPNHGRLNNASSNIRPTYFSQKIPRESLICRFGKALYPHYLLVAERVNT